MSRSQHSRTPVVDESQRGLTPEELEAMVIVDLPEREALSVAFPLAGPLSLVGAAKGAEAAAESVDDAVIDPGA